MIGCISFKDIGDIIIMGTLVEDIIAKVNMYFIKGTIATMGIMVAMDTMDIINIIKDTFFKKIK
jgi:hypothetical protein